MMMVVVPIMVVMSVVIRVVVMSVVRVPVVPVSLVMMVMMILVGPMGPMIMEFLFRFLFSVSMTLIMTLLMALLVVMAVGVTIENAPARVHHEQIPVSDTSGHILHPWFHVPARVDEQIRPVDPHNVPGCGLPAVGFHAGRQKENHIGLLSPHHSRPVIKGKEGRHHLKFSLFLIVRGMSLQASRRQKAKQHSA